MSRFKLLNRQKDFGTSVNETFRLVQGGGKALKAGSQNLTRWRSWAGDRTIFCCTYGGKCSLTTRDYLSKADAHIGWWLTRFLVYWEQRFCKSSSDLLKVFRRTFPTWVGLLIESWVAFNVGCRFSFRKCCPFFEMSDFHDLRNIASPYRRIIGGACCGIGFE